jgi:hypothetical protein
VILAPLRVSNKVQIIDPNTPAQIATVNPEGRLDVVQHANPDNGTIHFHVEGLTAGTYRYILIDISDNNNYPHVKTGFAHIEWLDIQADGNIVANYLISLGYLENVDANNGDRVVFKHWSRTREAGNLLDDQVINYPNGWRCKSLYHTTHDKSLNDINYQIDVNLPSTLDPFTTNTPSGDGDITLEIVVNAGIINVALDISYHGET